jgi:hypothetical protein
LQSADLAPTVPMLTAASELQTTLKKLLGRLGTLKTVDVAADQRTIARCKSAGAELRDE